MKMKIALVVLAAAVFCVLPASGQGFGTVSFGPLSGNCQSSPTLGIDLVNNDIYACGNAHIWKSAQVTLASMGAQAPITTVTTAQALFSIPACTSTILNQCMGTGAMNVLNRTMRFTGYLQFSNGVTAPAITISVSIGGTTVVSTLTAANANSNSNAPLWFACTVQTAAIGATGNDEAHCNVQEDTASAWTSGTAVNSFLDGQTAVSSNYDHTAANAIVINIAATAALTTVTARHLIAEFIQ